MKRAKRAVALVICAALVIGLMAFPASAAGSNGTIATLSDSYTAVDGSFTLTGSARFYIVAETAPSSQLLQTVQLAASEFAASGLPSAMSLPIAYGPESGIHTGDVVIRQTSGLGEEAYRLDVMPQNACVSFTFGPSSVYYGGSSCNGLLYGLRALLKCFITNGKTISCCTIQDSPDTAERAVMLDCARKYWSVEWIENLIREMSWMGYNELELHITEDQGAHMNIWSDGADSNGNDFSWLCGYEAASWASSYPDPNGGNNYSAAQIRRIVNTAKQYHVEIIPSVDFPGHCEYLISRYTSSGACNWFTFNYNGKNYSNRPSNIYYYNSGYGNSTSGNWGTIDITNDYARNLSLALIDAYADFFGELGCRKMNIGADEIRGTLDYSTFVGYINEICTLLQGQGYRVRAFNDYLYGNSSVALNRDLEICYWTESNNASIATYLNDGRKVFNCHSNYCYYVLRYNSSGGDARDQNNYWWSFHHATEDRIYNEWSPSRAYAYNAGSPTRTDISGGYFLIWGDWAGWNTESQVWNGTNSSRTYNLIDRMWSNSIKQWNWDINNSLSYSSFASYAASIRHYPGFTSCSAEPSVAGGAVIPSGVYTMNNLADQDFRVTVEDSSTGAGAKIHVWQSSSDNSQKWALWYMGNGYYTIENLNSHLYLDVPYANQASGTGLWQCAYNGSEAQQWRLQDNGNGSYSLISRCNGLALDMNGGGQPKNGTGIQVWTPNTSTAQQWVLTAQAVVPNGNYTIGNSADPSFVLDVDGISQDNGANVMMCKTNGGNNQRFTFEADAQGRYTIRAVHSGKVLDVDGGKATQGTNVQQYESNNTPAQKWMVIPCGDYYVIVSCCNNLALDMSGGGQPASGTNVQCWTPNWGSAQKWELTSVHTHAYEKTVTAPTCTERGYTTHTCACGDSYVDTYVSALGHRYDKKEVSGACDTLGYTEYTCRVCGYSYREYTDPTWSDWSTDEPSGIPADMLQTRTVYRYRDKITTISDAASLEGYNQTESCWVQSGTGMVDYVTSWPSGFSTSHSLYGAYHKSAPTASETASAKRTVGSVSTVGYIYWHWCTNNQYSDGPFNRYISNQWSSTYTGFHAFYSTTAPSSLTSADDCYSHANAGCCRDSYWYFTIPVYRQSYTDYTKQYTYEKWGDWSAWSESAYTASDTRQVESRTEYRYIINAAAGEHVWNDGTIKQAPSCTEAGIQTYTCTICGKTKTEEIAATGHAKVKDAAVAATCTKDGLTEGSHCAVCGKVLTAQTIVPAAHTPVTDPMVPATCTKDGLTEGSHCSVCGETLTAQQAIPASHQEEIDAAVAATCTATGLTEGSHCAVCGKVLTAQQIVEKIAHTPETDAAVAATCTATGLTEGSHCAVCGEVLTAQQTVEKIAHTPETDAAVAPTEESDGLTEGSHCAVCGEVLVAQTVIPALRPSICYSNLPSGVYTVANAADPNFRLDVEGASTRSQANVHIWSAHNGNQQKWIFWNMGNGYYTIENLNSGKYLDVWGAQTVDGTNIWQYDYNGGNAQQWRIVDNGDGTCALVSQCGNKVLDMNGGGQPKNGTNIQLWTSNDSTAQKWILEPQAVLQDGVYTIANSADTSFVLDMNCASQDNGASLLIGKANNGNNQRFAIQKDAYGYYTIRAVHSNKVLDVANFGTDNGTNIQQYTDNGTSNQKWLIIPYGGYYMFISRCNGLAMDMSGGGQPKQATNIHCWTINWGTAQKWKLTPATIGMEGVYTIGASSDSSYLLDIQGASKAQGANLALHQNHGGSNQQFVLQAFQDGYYGIRAVNSGLYLNVDNSGTANGTNVLQWGSAATPGENEKWSLIPNADGTYSFVAKCNGLYLNLADNSLTNSANVQMWQHSVASPAQRWVLTRQRTVTDGTYAVLSAANTTYGLDISAVSSDDRANVQSWAYGGGGNQRFIFTYAGNGYYTICASHSGKALDADGGIAANGTNVQQYTRNGSDAQLWAVLPNRDGSYTIVSKLGGFCLDLNGAKTANGTNVTLWEANGTAAQSWVLK